jgi:hypothetical protein
VTSAITPNTVNVPQKIFRSMLSFYPASRARCAKRRPTCAVSDRPKGQSENSAP